jgi:hypothetical protein
MTTIRIIPSVLRYEAGKVAGASGQLKSVGSEVASSPGTLRDQAAREQLGGRISGLDDEQVAAFLPALQSPVYNLAIAVLTGRDRPRTQSARGFAILAGQRDLWFLRPLSYEEAPLVEVSAGSSAAIDRWIEEVHPGYIVVSEANWGESRRPIEYEELKELHFPLAQNARAGRLSLGGISAMQGSAMNLSIEEVAFAISSMGYPDIAGGFLLSLMGPKEQAEMDGRLYAAAHSLMARGLLTVDVERGEQRLDPSFRECVGALVENDLTLRCSSATNVKERVVSYFLQADRIVSHEVRDDVVSCISVLPGKDALVRHCQEVLGVPQGPATTGVPVVWTPIEGSLVEMISNVLAAEGTEDVASQLVCCGMSPEDAWCLANDASRPERHGALTPIRLIEGQPVANASLLLLMGVERFWLFRPAPESDRFEVCLGTPALMWGQISALIC